VLELWELSAREQCRDTLAQYTHAGDRYLLDEFAAAFCEDGVLEVRGAEPVRGRAAIIERFGGAGAAEAARAAARAARSDPAGAVTDPAARGPAPIVRHNVTNIRFEFVSPSEALVASYFAVVTGIGLDHAGRYRDRLVPAEGRWLIAHRFVSVDWRAEGSTFGLLAAEESP
jgi:hypothetical protein